MDVSWIVLGFTLTKIISVTIWDLVGVTQTLHKTRFPSSGSGPHCLYYSAMPGLRNLVSWRVWVTPTVSQVVAEIIFVSVNPSTTHETSISGI